MPNPAVPTEIAGAVVAVCLRAEPGLPKTPAEAIELIEDFGVRGDYHAGPLVRHRYLAKKDPARPNVRQVLLTDTTILADLAGRGIVLDPGMLGENIVLDGVSVMAWPAGTHVRIGLARLEVTEVRNPCRQLNGMHPRLLEAVSAGVDGRVQPNAGMMARVLSGGRVKPGDAVMTVAALTGSAVAAATERLS